MTTFSGPSATLQVPSGTADIRLEELRPFSRYTSVRCFHLYWQGGALPEREAYNLARVWSERFGYHTEFYAISPVDTPDNIQHNLINQLRGFLLRTAANQDQDELLIVHYGGNAIADETDGLILRSTSEQGAANVNWNIVQDYTLSRSRKDILIILDCCYAGAVIDRCSTLGRIEVLAACSADSRAADGVVHRSFTEILILELRSMPGAKRVLDIFEAMKRSQWLKYVPCWDEIKESRPGLIVLAPRDAQHPPHQVSVSDQSGHPQSSRTNSAGRVGGARSHETPAQARVPSRWRRAVSYICRCFVVDENQAMDYCKDWASRGVTEDQAIAYVKQIVEHKVEQARQLHKFPALHKASGESPSQLRSASMTSDSGQKAGQPSLSEAKSELCQDPASGVETLWEFGPNVRLLAEDGGYRSFHRKRVEYSRIYKSSNLRLTGYHLQDKRVLKIGKVIELLLVPPKSDLMRDKSLMAPSHGFPLHSNIRARQMVIVDKSGEAFKAVPIKTYNNLGVAASGIIKSHHMMIYTGKRVPKLTLPERPVQIAEERWESDILGPPLRAHPLVKNWALSELSRLDLSDIHDINLEVQAIKLIGEIDEASVGVLNMQCRVANASIVRMARFASGEDDEDEEKDGEEVEEEEEEEESSEDDDDENSDEEADSRNGSD